MAEAKSAANAVIAATDELLAAIDVVDAERMDRLVTLRSAEKWTLVYDHADESLRNQDRMVSDIATALGAAGCADAEDQARDIMEKWRWSGTVVTPSSAPDFKNTLGEFRAAFGLVARDLVDEGKAPEGEPRPVTAWQEFLAALRQWARKHRHPTGVTKLDAYDNHGAFVYLVKEINNWLPEPYRRRVVKDGSLAKSIGDALRTYDAGAALMKRKRARKARGFRVRGPLVRDH